MPMSTLLPSLALVAVFSLATPAVAQRVSLADRVAALECRLASSQSNADLLTQIAQLRAETQALRAQIEELQQSRDAAAALAKAQALDVDSRLGRLEAPKFAAAAMATKAAPGAMPAAPRAGAPVRASGSATPPAAPARIATTPHPTTDDSDASGTPTGAELAAYTTAFDALKSARYAESSLLFAAFIDRYPGSVYAPNALYWLGESHYATRAYAQALAPFQQLVERFPTHDKAAGGLLKIGLTELNLQHDLQARAALAEVIARYPASDAARSAADRLQALQPRP